MRSLGSLHFARCVTLARPWSFTAFPQRLQVALPSVAKKRASTGLSIEPRFQRGECCNPRRLLFRRLVHLENHLESLLHGCSVRLRLGVPLPLNLGDSQYDLTRLESPEGD